MISRRSFVATSLTCTSSVLSGCLWGSDNDDHAASESEYEFETEEIGEYYQDEVADHINGVGALEEGFSAYHNSAYESASDHFDTAVQDFASANFDGILVLTEEQREPTLIVESAKETNSAAEAAAQECTFASSSLDFKSDQPDRREEIESIEQQYNQGEFDIPTRQELEEAFNSE